VSHPIITLDFETYPIEPRPDYPPKPVGLAVIPPGSRNGSYLAWGHPRENNATLEDGRRVIRKAWDSGAVLLFHNASFDVEVAMEAFGVRYPDPERVRDTLIEAFLYDPNALALHLKDLAHLFLGEPPSERDELYDWLGENVPEAKKKKNRGRWIYLGPGRLVGRYAIGDVCRTLGLHRFFAPKVRRMEEAYAIERALSEVLIGMERAGVPLAEKRLARDLKVWEARLAKLDVWIKRALGMDPEDSVDERDKVADGLAKRGMVEKFVITDAGNRSTSYDNLMVVINNPSFASAYGYRSKLATSVRTFARPWLEMSRRSGGKIFTRWNQVRQADEERGRSFGARTGRLSSNPNFQNVPVRLPAIVTSSREFRDLMRRGVECFHLPRGCDDWLLPNLRDYIVAGDVEEVILDGDFSQQELKILAHYERGEMLRAYLANPKLDIHQHARQMINSILGTDFERKPIKNVGFAIIYGTGAPHLAEMINTELAVARQVRNAYKQRVFPGLAKLDAELRTRASRGEPMMTRGGRLYHVEPPRLIKGVVRRFEYKMINTLVQGSAADMIKRSMLKYAKLGGLGRMVLTVHDELVVVCPRGALRDERMRMIESGRALAFDLPIEMDFSAGPTWARLKEVR